MSEPKVTHLARVGDVDLEVTAPPAASPAEVAAAAVMIADVVTPRPKAAALGD